MKSETELLNAVVRQDSEARRLGWRSLYHNTQSSPDMGKWRGHRSRLFGVPPGGDSAQLVPDFFNEVVPALDTLFPLP